MQIKDRTFIVSGGSSGLGLATTSLFLENGANVSILDLNPPPSNTFFHVDSSRILFTKTNVASTESLQTAVKSTLKWIQETTSKPLSGAICCAGIGTAALSLPRQDASATHDNVKYMDMGTFDRTIAINLRGTVDLIRLTIPHMALNEPWGPDGERGIVIVVSSVAAYEGQVGQLAYSASKGAVRSIVLPLARELGLKAGIRAMGIAPGVFQTGMTVPPKKNNSSSPVKKEGNESKSKGATGSRAAVNPEMIQYPMRMGRGEEFARLVKEIVENPMLNGGVIRLDGAVRMPSRL
ncbi:putative oxidoreductase [Exophiala dermatitidis]|uniref:3-hydroxyacyl-CoA dehydrogenase n=1 Tax=Exophiala dermatitidis (strain ATCC 34100 / CBS 525.76 / NIH/UT8656) TaxID=858893 RepID=H6BYZ5_EXODN|nr:3-hydroxyacyl-CoA dehydrogenase [Exophiala dermatitidis NIH/UT8656]EHY56858.1 3-hydroxyacyl-CoA dehydrogenase [Exophiala dermatitidis NIH/UT8656]